MPPSPPTPGTTTTAVVDRVRRMLTDGSATRPYREALTVALALPGNILSDAPDTRWARLVWTCCSAAGGYWECGVSTAAAVEVFMVALDVLDDEEDDEGTVLHADLGRARALNVSTGLLFLAQRSLLATAHGSAAAAILLDAGLCACSGQDADLEGLHEPEIERSLAVTAAKSASLVAGVCQLGALCAGADTATLDQFGHFGWHLGMVKQLGNDLAALHPDAQGKTDRVLGRPTLPLTYAAMHEPACRPGDETQVQPESWVTGSTYLTWAAAQTYRIRAHSLIPRLTDDPTCRDDLAALVPSLS